VKSVGTITWERNIKRKGNISLPENSFGNADKDDGYEKYEISITCTRLVSISLE
jgi:hypothetical protein